MEASSQTTGQKRFDASQGPRIIGPDGGKAVDLGSIGARFMAWTEETGGGFSLVEHPMPPRRLAAPIHRHSREDEYSFVVEGRMGALLGDDVVYAEVGDLAFKPRDSGIPSGTPVTSPAGSWRSSRRAASSISSMSSGPSWRPRSSTRRSSGSSEPGTGWSFSPKAWRGCARSMGSIIRCCTRASRSARSP